MRNYTHEGRNDFLLRLVPHYPCFPPSGELDAYLRGNTVPADADVKGYAAVLADGYPVGFGKAVEGTMKNHLPKGLRIMG